MGTEMDNIVNSIWKTLPGFALFLGIVECFFGYRMLKVILGVTGFIFVGLLCSELVYKNMGGHPVIALIAGLFGGAIGSVLMIGLFSFGLFVLGAVLGFIAGEALSRIIVGSVNPIIVVPIAIVGGVATIIMFKEMVIISTSFIGAYMTVSSIGSFLGMSNRIFGFHQFNRPRVSDGQFIIMLLLSIIVGIAGMIVQHRYTATSEAMEKNSRRGRPPMKE